MLSRTKSYDVLAMTMLIQFQKKGKVSTQYADEQKKLAEKIKNIPPREKEEEEFELIYIKM